MSIPDESCILVPILIIEVSVFPQDRTNPWQGFKTEKSTGRASCTRFVPFFVRLVTIFCFSLATRLFCMSSLVHSVACTESQKLLPRRFTAFRADLCCTCGFMMVVLMIWHTLAFCDSPACSALLDYTWISATTSSTERGGHLDVWRIGFGGLLRVFVVVFGGVFGVCLLWFSRLRLFHLQC